MEVTFLAAKLFSCYLITLFLLLFTGDCIFYAAGISIERKNFFTQFFFRLLLGVIFIVVVYSITCTSFKTINLGFLILLVPALIFKGSTSWLNKSSRWNLHQWRKAALFIFLAGGLFFLWQAVGFIKAGPYHFSLNLYRNIGQEDYIVYSHISNYIKTTGQENFFRSANLIDNIYHGTNPYHYFEIWMNAAVSSLFHLSSFVTLQLICYPFFYCVVLSGIAGLIELYVLPNRNTLLFALLLMFASGIYFTFFSRINLLEPIYGYAIVPMTAAPKKLMVYYAFAIAALLLYHQSKKEYALLCLFCLPITSSDMSFAVFGGAGLFLAFCFFFRRIELKHLRILVLTLLMLVLFIGLFYIITGNKQAIPDTSANFTDLLNKKDLITRLNIIGASPIHFAAVYSPFILLAVFMIGRVRIHSITKEALLLCLFSWLSGLIGWAFFYKLSNSYQFFKNPAMVLSNVILIFFIIKFAFEKAFTENLSRGKKKFILAGVTLILLFSFIKFHIIKTRQLTGTAPARYSDEYLLAISRYTDQHDIGLKGGYIRSTYDPYSTSDYMSVWLPLGEYLILTSQPVLATDLSIFSINLDYSDSLNRYRLENFISQSPFYLFVSKQKTSGTFTSIEQSQADFINENQMKFLILDSGATAPAVLSPLVKQSFTDSLSRERFLVLEN